MRSPVFGFAARAAYVVSATVFCGLLHAQPGANARPPVCEQMSFTVGEAVAYALVHNPALRAARAAIGEAEGAVINATLLENPDVEISYSKERVRERDLASGAITNTRARDKGASLAQAFNITGKRPAAVMQARAALDAARADIAEQELELVESTKVSIAEFVGNTRGVAILHNKVLGVKPLMWQLTEGKEGDRIRAEMSFLDIQQEMRNDREELMEVETELNGWLGLPADTRLFIQDTIEPVPPPIGYKDLWATILARNINVKSACAQLRAARLNLELAMRDRVPDLAASASYTKTKEVSKDAIAIHKEWDTALGSSIKLYDQNQGVIKAAAADLIGAGFHLTDVEWAVGNELYKMYQAMALFRSRVRVMEYGYLARLEKLMYELDPDDYDADKIAFNDWESHLKRYHLDGDELVTIKINYKESLATLERVCGGSFTCPVQLPKEDTGPPPCYPKTYGEGIALKARRGLGNLALSPVELPASIYGNICDRGPWGLIVGPFEGVVSVFERGGAGAFDLVTSLLPWPIDGMQPVSPPVEGADPWWGSWNLKYFHPAYEYDNQRFHPAYSGTPMVNDGNTTGSAVDPRLIKKKYEVPSPAVSKSDQTTETIKAPTAEKISKSGRQ